MKNWILVILGLLAGVFAGHYWGASRQEVVYQEKIVTAESGWEQDRARLEAALEAERRKPPKVEVVYKELPASYTNVLSPAEMLAKLVELRPNLEERRNVTFRKIIYYMQGLADAGPYAFPVIGDFLQQNVDVDYTQYDISAAGERRPQGGDPFVSRNMVRTDFLVPPSLRLGLLSVLGQEGGEEAERMLAETLATSARGVEVAYLTRMLHEIQPNAYRELALQAARELLAEPPPFESPNRLDENAKAYLYDVLKMYNDTAFAETAQTLLVGEDGRIDAAALNYVNEVMKEHSVPAILAAYNDPRVESQREKSKLLNTALAYTGPNLEANQLFYQVVTNQSIPAGIRAYSIQGLSGSSQQPTPSDPHLVKARIEFLDAISATLSEERLIKALEASKKKLEDILSGAVTPN